VSSKASGASQPFLQVFHGYLAISKYLVQQPRPDRLARVDGHHCTTAVFVTEEMMAASDSHDCKPNPSERGYQFGASDARAPAHAAMVIR
jgi:hypothetical protein